MPDSQNSSDLVDLVERLRAAADRCNNPDYEPTIRLYDLLHEAANALTAPAMLNGVEGLVDVVHEGAVADAILHEKNGWAVDYHRNIKAGLELAAKRGLLTIRAADNRDAAGVEPAPNWCRTCGKNRRDPAAVLCSDGIHREDTSTAVVEYRRGYAQGAIDARKGECDCCRTKAVGPTHNEGGEAVAWTTTKPTVPGAYWVRGYAFRRPTEKALVEVREVGGELCSNLHATNSDDEDDVFGALTVHSDRFEWLGPLTTHPPAAEVRETRIAADWVIAYMPAGLDDGPQWPPGYVRGYNDAAKLCADQVEYAFAEHAALSPPGRAEGEDRG